MNTNRKATILAGALYFLGIIAGVFSVIPVIDIPDYLVQVSGQCKPDQSGAVFASPDDSCICGYGGCAVSHSEKV